MRERSLVSRTLSLLEGPTMAALTRAKAWNMKGGLDLTQDPNRTFRRMRGFRNIYLQGGYVAEGIDLFPIYALGGGYEIEIDEKIAEKLGTDGEAEQQTVKEFFELINFFDVQWQLSVDAAVVRDGVAEIVYGRGQASTVPINVIPRPAECFEFTTNTTGTIESYDQMYDNRGNSITKIPLEPAQVLHYQFLSRPDSPYGISLIERTVHDIGRDTKVTEAITAGICLHGTPKWHVKANSTKVDAVPLTDAEYKGLEDEFEGFNAKDQFVTEGDIVVAALDTAGVPNVQMYSDVTLIRVVAGMGIPGELLGVRQGTTDATAVSRIGAFLKKIKIVQRDIESLWNLNIIDKLTAKPGLVKLKLNDASPEDFVQISAAIAQLRSGQNPEKVAPYQWCRQRLNIPTNEELGIEEVPEDEPAPDPSQTGLQDWLDQQKPGDPAWMPTDKSDEEIAATKEMAAAAHELSQIVRGATREMGDEDGNWITINGTHIFLRDGETPAEGFKRVTKKDLPSTHDHNTNVLTTDFRGQGGKGTWKDVNGVRVKLNEGETVQDAFKRVSGENLNFASGKPKYSVYDMDPGEVKTYLYNEWRRKQGTAPKFDQRIGADYSAGDNRRV